MLRVELAKVGKTQGTTTFEKEGLTLDSSTVTYIISLPSAVIALGSYGAAKLASLTCWPSEASTVALSPLIWTTFAVRRTVLP